MVLKMTMHWYQSYLTTSKHYIITVMFLCTLQLVFNDSQRLIQRGQPRKLSIQNGHKCLPVIDRADKAIHGSSEALAYSM